MTREAARHRGNGGSESSRRRFDGRGDDRGPTYCCRGVVVENCMGDLPRPVGALLEDEELLVRFSAFRTDPGSL